MSNLYSGSLHVSVCLYWCFVQLLLRQQHLSSAAREFQVKNIYLSLSTMNGGSEYQSQHNITTSMWLFQRFKSWWRHFWISVAMLSQTFLHTHSTAGKTPPGNNRSHRLIWTIWWIWPILKIGLSLTQENAHGEGNVRLKIPTGWPFSLISAYCMDCQHLACSLTVKHVCIVASCAPQIDFLWH